MYLSPKDKRAILENKVLKEQKVNREKEGHRVYKEKQDLKVHRDPKGNKVKLALLEPMEKMAKLLYWK